MIVQLNNDQFIVLDDEYNEAVKNFKNDWVKVSEWIEFNGVAIPEDHLVLTKDEVIAIADGLKNHYINRDNELFSKTITKMMLFAQGDINARQG